MKYISLVPPTVWPTVEDDDNLLYPGEMLSDVIARSMEMGVMASPEFATAYDDTDDVDPACDVRTDRFALAEAASEQRAVREAMTREASKSSDAPVKAEIKADTVDTTSKVDSTVKADSTADKAE